MAFWWDSVVPSSPCSDGALARGSSPRPPPLTNWLHGVMVNIRGFDSRAPSSILGAALFFLFFFYYLFFLNWGKLFFFFFLEEKTSKR